MTAAELLARLPDRPTAQPGQLATADARLRHARDRAEFDRALLLDCWESYMKSAPCVTYKTRFKQSSPSYGATHDIQTDQS